MTSSPFDDRPSLVLAPGMLSDAAVWLPQAAAFGGDMDVRVAHYGEARSLTAMAEALLDQTPGRFALAGHSMGGRVALEAARLAPERITGLCLISSDCLPKAGGDAGEAETRARYALVALAREQGMAALADRFVPTLLICGAEDGFGRAPLQAAMTALLSDAPTLLIERCGHLPTLEAPETVSWAMRDWLAEVGREALRAEAAI